MDITSTFFLIKIQPASVNQYNLPLAPKKGMKKKFTNVEDLDHNFKKQESNTDKLGENPQQIMGNRHNQVKAHA